MSSPRYRLEASRAQGHGTISVALVTIPVARHSKTPTLAEWHEPRSSALMMRSLAPASYPRRCASVGSLMTLLSFGDLGVLRPGGGGDLLLELLHARRQDGI